MTLSDFKDYRREYEAEGIGELLYDLILNLVEQVVVRYPPEVYSPNQIWDEDAVTALCHDFTVDKLLEAGWLEHHLLTQETIVGLKKVLGQNFRHFLISRKRRSEYSNLFGRVKKILRDDPRFRVVHKHTSVAAGIWGLSEWERKEVAQHPDRVVEAMFAVELPPLVRYRADSKKLSHLLSNHDLGRLLESTFRIADKYISLGLLMDGLRYRLNMLEVDSVSLDEPVGELGRDSGLIYADIVPDLVDLEMKVTSAQIAEDIFERLTDRQRRVLALRLSLMDPTLEQIGECVGVSKSTVHDDLAVVSQYIVATDITQEEAEEVLLRLSEICEGYFERTNGNTIQSHYGGLSTSNLGG